MNGTRIHSIRATPDGKSVEGRVDLGNYGSTKLWFRSSESVLEASTSAFLAAALLPSMALGMDCTIDGVVSARLLRSVEKIQDIFHTWDPRFHRIRVSGAAGTAGTVLSAGADTRGAASFFSGGIDSLYTLSRHHSEIDSLILIHGFDIDLDHHALWKQVSDKLREFASKTGKSLFQIETNVGVFLRKYVGWSFGHGPALAAVGHLLAPRLRRIFIPATHTLADHVEWGSHPLVDPLWSSEALEFVHDGSEVTRVHKTETVANWPAAMDCLRVCWKNDGGVYNCGHCEKCLRTMVTLQMLGALEAQTAFAEPLDLGRVASLRVFDDNSRAFAKEILTDPRLVAREPALYAAVQNWIRPASFLERLRQATRRIRLRRSLRSWRARLRASRR
jgi:hypothetical protein